MKRIYVVVEFSGNAAVVKDAFENENEARDSMNKFMEKQPSSIWAVESCTLHEK